ncbi:hypothetical protein LSUCC0246_09940 [Rhodobacterales bacterium LSUCC0246]|nr:hypothetical protein [Rhodobacterales bacterium LSUCC0374]
MNAKIFIGLGEVAGYYSSLKHGFDELGVPCDLVFVRDHPFGYNCNSYKGLMFSLLRIVARRADQVNSNLKRILILLENIIQIIWSIYVIIRYDYFIFSFGRTFWPGNLDLPLLKLLGKKAIVNIAHGSDARPPFMDGFLLNRMPHDPILTDYIYKISKRKSKKIDFILKNAFAVIGSPMSTSPFATKSFINTFYVGAPFRPTELINYECDYDKKYKVLEEKSLVIVHAPSSPVAKGTEHIEYIVNNLISEGYDIDFRLLKNMTNSEVISVLASCDILVDQMYSDTPMSGVATEAAYYGKPSVVGGYGFGTLADVVAPQVWPPSMTCQPEEMYDTIRYMIENKPEREAIGLRAQSFVKSHRSPVNVAKNYLRILKNETPDHWRFNPDEFIYWEGAGQSRAEIKKIIKALLTEYTSSGLFLDKVRPLTKKILSEVNYN